MSTPFGDCLPRAVGNPAGARLRGTPRERDVSVLVPSRAGPPRGHPASNGSVLDGTLPASGRLATTIVPEHGSGGERCRLFDGQRPGRIVPSDTFTGDGAERRAPGCLSPELAKTGARQCNQLLEPEVPSIERDPHERSFEVRGARLLRWPANLAPHVFIDVRKRRLDLWPPAVRVRLRGRVPSYDFCK